MTNNHCTECGAVLKPDEKFCTECGAKVSAIPQQTVPVRIQQPVTDTRNRTISTIEWIGIYILLMLPIINIIVLIVWAMSSTCRLSLRNYARAMLIIMVIMFILGIIIGIMFASILPGIIGWFTDYGEEIGYDLEDIFSQMKNSPYGEFFSLYDYPDIL
jgi:Uncharacterized Zn-finger containing protein